ncbi:O-antigen ligase [Aeribacillus composti]|uniref:O-antigen polymerase n=1 Tax=Aeribacillus composti TaxID=1868734 RepID=UPI002E2150C1|nr:O-antigen ligase [Aeribacillus composti]
MDIKSFWWTNPGKIIFFFIVPVYVIIFLFSANSPSINGTFNFFDFEIFFQGLILLCLFGFTLGIFSNVSLTKNYEIKINIITLDFVAIFTIIAYFFWFGELIRNFDLIINILSGNSTYASGVRMYINTIPGITTLSQFGVVYVTLYKYFVNFKNVILKKHYKFLYWIILILTLFRTIVWSERLALIEILIPIILLSKLKLKVYKKIRVILFLGPYMGVLFLYLYFGIFEYFRSWASYYKFIYDNYWGFIFDRISNYYLTALNNGAGVINVFNSSFDFQYTFAWVYKFPILGEVLRDYTGLKSTLNIFLDNYGNREFNNLAGIFAVYHDFGFLGASVVMVVLGIIVGLLYNLYSKNSIIGVLLYPTFFIFLLEILRIFYIGEPRTTPIIFLSLLLLLVVGKRKGEVN